MMGGCGLGSFSPEWASVVESIEHNVELSCSIKIGEFLEQLLHSQGLSSVKFDILLIYRSFYIKLRS
jgi:hypothetical protein